MFNLDTLERFHIFCTFKQNKHLNDNNIDVHNPIFNTVYKHKRSTTDDRRKIG
jgi:hypothetical protein